MAGGLEKYTPRRAGLKAILKSAGVQRDLQARADRVAAVLRTELADEDDWEIVSDVRVGPVRAGALVSGVPMRIEIRERIMARAIEAAR
jgi:hypothetical protein